MSRKEYGTDEDILKRARPTVTRLTDIEIREMVA